jgi:hypothetical protein
MEHVNQERVNHLQAKMEIPPFCNHLIRLYKLVIEMEPYVHSEFPAILEQIQAIKQKEEEEAASKLHAALHSATTSKMKTLSSTTISKPISSKNRKILHTPISSINESVDSKVGTIPLVDPEPKMLGGSDLDVTTEQIDLELFGAYINAVNAVDIAIQAAEQVAKTWDIGDQITSLIKSTIEQTGRETGVIFRKSAEIVEIVDKCSKEDIKVSSYDLLKDKIKHYDYRYSDTALYSHISFDRDNSKFPTDIINAWIKDINGTFKVATREMWTRSNQSWANITDQVANIVQSITDVQQTMQDKRPYLNIQLVFPHIKRHYRWNEYIYTPEEVYSIIRGMESVVQAMILFQKMDEKMDQIEEEALALVKALHKLLPSSKGHKAGLYKTGK